MRDCSAYDPRGRSPIRPGPGPRDDRPIDVTKIRATCLRELPSYKQPLYYEVLERFPLTSGYKIDREALARLAPGAGSPHGVQRDDIVTQ